MANFLERIGFVEKVQPPSPKSQVGYEDTGTIPIDFEEDTETVNTDSIKFESLISDTYAANQLEDTDRSIFKVGEICKNLPSTMPVETKRETVKGILASFNITVEDMDADAKKRYTVINAVCNEMCDEESAKINQLEKEVEELYQAAEAKKTEIAERTNTLNGIIDVAKEERERIENLWSFITGKEQGNKEE